MTPNRKQQFDSNFHPDLMRSKRMWYRASVLIIIAALLTSHSWTTAQASQDQAQRSAATVQAFTPLLSKAEAAATVRVIVGLRATFRPEGVLSGRQAVQTQRTAIASAQSALMNRLSAYNVTAVKQFKFIPYVAMEVNAAALRYSKLRRTFSVLRKTYPCRQHWQIASP